MTSDQSSVISSDLFGSPDPEPRPPNPGPRPFPRGRGATAPVLEQLNLPGKNPTGHSQIRFRYRPLKAWSADHIADARKMVMAYAAQIGGLRIADDAVMRAAISALADFTAQEISWAIAAKAASLVRGKAEEIAAWRARRSKFLGRPEGFFSPSCLAAWLAKSHEYQQVQEKAAVSQINLSRSRLEARKASSAAEASIAAGQAAWSAISPAQRELIMARRRADFERWGDLADMSNPRFAGLCHADAVILQRRQSTAKP